MARGVYSTSNYFEYAGGIVTAAPLTFACWIYPTAFTVVQYLMSVSRNDGGAAPDGFMLFIPTNAILSAQTVNNGSAATATSTALSANVWRHAAGVIASATSRTAYRNGVAGTEETTSKTPATTPDTTNIGARILRDASVNNPATLTTIAESAIWNAALTAAEILQLSLGYSPLFVRPESLVAYYPLIRGDSSGNEPDYMGGLTMVEQGTVAVATHARVFYPSSPIKLGVPAAAAPPAGNPWYAWQQM